MARPLSIEFENAFYHVMSRGLNRQILFNTEEDFKFFLYLLNQGKEKFKFICHSFCLMNNHYHLYLQTPIPNLSLAMKYINESYARYFLKKYPDKDGHVFKGRYKRKIVQSDLYSWQLSRYIHLNPVKAKLVDHPHQWQWSSYSSYLGLSLQNHFLETEWLSKQYSSDSTKARELITKYTYEGLTEDWDPDDHTIAKLVLGSSKFFNHILDNHVNQDDLNYDILAAEEFKVSKNIKPELIFKRVQGLQLSNKLKEKLLIYYLKEHTNMGLVQIGDIVSMKPKTVSKSYTRTKKMLLQKSNLQGLITLE